MNALDKVDPEHELEGWKEIADALGVSEAAAKRYGSAGTSTRLPLPTYLNFRGRRAARLTTVRLWKAGGVFARPAPR
jgi:hypothetical protein